MLKVKSLIVFLLIFKLSAVAQSDSISTAGQNRKWYAPDGILVQYAGGTGLLSAGVVYHPGKKTEVDITVGYTPPAYGNIYTANLFTSYRLMHLKINKKLSLDPLNAGLFFNFNFAKNIYVIWPSRYPERYYWWNSSMRCGPFVNSEIKYIADDDLNLRFFFQANTNDLYLLSYANNTGAIMLHQILVFGAGIKIGFEK